MNLSNVKTSSPNLSSSNLPRVIKFFTGARSIINARVFVKAQIVAALMCGAAAAEVGSGIELGVGARAAAFAGNHVAVAKDMSAVYWNPAALAFMPVREVHFTLEGMRFTGDSEFFDGVTIPNDARMGGSRDRIRVGSLGWMTAIPTIQGGLTIAASFDRPFSFDDYTNFEIERDGMTEWDDWIWTRANRRVYGDLNRWNGAFGIQVGPQLSIGATLSLLTGTMYSLIEEGAEFVDEELDFYYDGEYRTRYQGFGMTFGLLYRPLENLDLGLRIDESYLRYSDAWKEAGDRRYRNGNDGRAYRAPRITLGAGYRHEFFTAAADLRITLPQTLTLDPKDADDMPDDMQAREFKFGAGAGVEVPIPTTPIVLRAGYSFDQYDIYPMIYRIDNTLVDWDDGAWSREFYDDFGRHTVGAGFGVFGSGIGFELAYSYQIWAAATDNLWGDGLRFRQNYSTHRIVAGIIYRY